MGVVWIHRSPKLRPAGAQTSGSQSDGRRWWNAREEVLVRSIGHAKAVGSHRTVIVDLAGGEPGERRRKRYTVASVAGVLGRGGGAVGRGSPLFKVEAGRIAVGIHRSLQSCRRGGGVGDPPGWSRWASPKGF